MWNLVSTAMACPTHRPVSTNPTLCCGFQMEYLTHQVRKRVGPWSNKTRVNFVMSAFFDGPDLYGNCVRTQSGQRAARECPFS